MNKRDKLRPTAGGESAAADSLGIQPIADDPVLTVADVARRLGRHRDTIKRYIDCGLIDGFWVAGRRCLGVRESALQRFLGGVELASAATPIERVFTTTEVAEFMGKPRTTVRGWIAGNLLEGVWLSESRVFGVRRSALIEFLPTGQEVPT